MLKTVIIEDEHSAQLLLSNILKEYCPTIEHIGTAANLKGSTELIKNSKPDLIFIDIDLEDCTAFDVLKSIDYNQFKIIFTTAYEEHAAKAFRYEAIDYILKPYHPKDIITAIERVKERDYDNRLLDKLAQVVPTINSKNNKISLPTSKGIMLVADDDILHIEADGSYTKVHTKDGKSIYSSKGMKEMESQLSSSNFFRTHTSHLVNIYHIKEFLKQDGASVILSNLKSVPVSRRKKPELLKLLSLGIS